MVLKIWIDFPSTRHTFLPETILKVKNQSIFSVPKDNDWRKAQEYKNT